MGRVVLAWLGGGVHVIGPIESDAGMTQSPREIEVLALSFMQADMRFGHGVLAQKGARAHAGHVEPDPVKPVGLTQPGHQDAVGFDAGQAVQQGGAAPECVDVSGFDHRADCAAAGLIEICSRPAQGLVFEDANHDAGGFHRVWGFVVQCEFHGLKILFIPVTCAIGRPDALGAVKMRNSPPFYKGWRKLRMHRVKSAPGDRE